MRVFTTSLTALAVILALAACGGSKSSSTDSSSTDQSAGAAATAAAAPAAAATSAGDIPEYPGAATEAAGSSSSMGTDAAGKVLTTGDSFDKVYAWYQKNMPAGSEKSHVTSPIETAVFTIGEAGSGQSSVTLTTHGGKTMITIGHVKM